jgi:hypothetical protein
MQTAQGYEDAMRQGRLGKSYGIIRSGRYFTLTCNWEMSALTKSISVGSFKPPSPPVHVHSCRFPNLDIFVCFLEYSMYTSSARLYVLYKYCASRNILTAKGGLPLRMGSSISSLHRDSIKPR